MALKTQKLRKKQKKLYRKLNLLLYKPKTGTNMWA